MEQFGVLSLLPAASVLLLAIFTKRPIESLIAGCFIGLLMTGTINDVLLRFSDLALDTMKNETIGWIILVCGLMGSLIMLFLRTGAAVAFSELVATRAKSRRSALVGTWLLGLFIFLDDYLNALAVGTSMRKLTDKYKVSREMLAYVVDSTAAPICILLPVSTWAIFFVGVLESNQVVAAGEGFSLYIASIPYMFYAWVAVLLVPLVGAGIFPVIGPMKKAEARAASETFQQQVVEASGQGESKVIAKRPAGAMTFILPILLMIAIAWYNDMNMLLGVVCTVLITIVVVSAQRIITLTESFEAVWDGVRLMVPALAIIVTSFMFKSVNDDLGVSRYVIDTLTPLMSASLLPVVCFFAIALVAFATAAFWGVLAIAVPIILPLAEAMGTPLPVVIGAMMSAAAFGSHACFYSDSTVLAAQGSGVGVMPHALTQLPYVLISASGAIVLWLAWALMG